MRTQIPILITFVFGLFMVLDYFVSPQREGVHRIGAAFQSWTTIITAFAFVLGVANIVRINLGKVSKRGEDRPYAAVLLVGLFGMLAIGVFGGLEEGTLGFDVFTYVFTPMQATMFSLLAFYIGSAAFRAFRIRTIDAGLLAITAVLVMIGRVPIGDMLSNALGLPDAVSLSSIQGWVMNVPNLAAKRAILIGAALGAIATALKVIIGVERNYLGE
jgi:hypothetical protein